MKPIEKLRASIIDGERQIPQSASELVTFIDQYNFVSTCKDDIEDRIASLKCSFLDKHKSKAGGGPSCYTSRIADSLLTRSVKKFNDIFKFLYGHDAIAQVITELVAEGKIKIVGKKVHLIKDGDTHGA